LPAKIVRFVESQIDLHSTKVKKMQHYITFWTLCLYMALEWRWKFTESTCILFWIKYCILKMSSLFIPKLYFALLWEIVG
jgi:hypothetical protein